MVSVPRVCWETELFELLERLRAVSVELSRLSRQQRRSIETGREGMAGLRRLSNARRNACDHLARLMQRLEPYRLGWSATAPVLGAGVLEGIRCSVARLVLAMDAVLDDEEGASCD